MSGIGVWGNNEEKSEWVKKQYLFPKKYKISIILFSALLLKNKFKFSLSSHVEIFILRLKCVWVELNFEFQISQVAADAYFLKWSRKEEKYKK